MVVKSSPISYIGSGVGDFLENLQSKKELKYFLDNWESIRYYIVMKKVILFVNLVFDYIVIGIIHIPFIALYILLSPVLFLTWLYESWVKAVRWAENG